LDAELNSMRQEQKLDAITLLVSHLTVEHVLYLLILIVASILRLVELDFVPLSPGEASEAIAVWNFWQPGSIDLEFISPVYFTLTALFTQIAGFSDAVMRFVPVLFGIGVVLLPLTIRHRTGKIGALVASLFLALSPALVHISRTAGGQSVAIFSGLLLFISWIRFQESKSETWFWILAVALALGLTSDPLFFSITLSLFAAWVVHYYAGPHLLLDEDGTRRFWFQPGRRLARDGLILFLVVFVLLATAFLMATRGIGATADLFAGWLGKFFRLTETRSLISPFTAVSRIEFVLLILGIPSLIWAARKEKALPIFLGYWISFGLLLMLLQPGSINNIFILVLPGYLLIGNFADNVFRKFSRWPNLFVFLVMVVGGSIGFTNFIRFGRLTSFQLAGAGSFHLLLVFTVIVLAAIAATIIWSWSEQQISAGLFSGIVLFLLLGMWSNAWWLSHAGGSDTREPFIGTATDESLRLMAANLEDISWQLTNSKNGLQIASTVDTPSLRWYLRDIDGLAYTSTLTRVEMKQALITPVQDLPTLANQFVGTEYAILRSETELQLDWRQALSWWLFREVQTPIQKERVIFWLRADLAGETL